MSSSTPQPPHQQKVQDACMSLISQTPALLQHETQLQQQPYQVTVWLLYLDTIDDMLVSNKNNNSSSKKMTTVEEFATLGQLRDWIGRRAVALLPRSYKLWKNHYDFRVQQFTQQQQQQQDNALQQQQLQDVLDCFERSLWTLSAYPRVWIDYLSFVKDHPGCKSITAVRRLWNRAWQSLPVTQHDKVWPTVLEWINPSTIPTTNEEEDEDNKDPQMTAAVVQKKNQWNIPLETKVRLLRRYCQFDALYRNDFAEFLVTHERWGEAAVQYQQLLNYTTSASTDNASDKRDLYWQAYSELCTQHPVEVEHAGVQWEQVLRGVLNETKSATKVSSSSLLEGLLWTQLADSWIRRGSFDIARSVYEEGLEKVKTVRDFSVLYDAYLQFEEGLLEAATSTMEDVMDEEEGEEAKTGDDDGDDWDILLEETADSKLAEMELAVARAEHLTSRRPLLLNAVVLRQTPHSVKDWLQRADLYLELELPGQAAATCEEALKTVVAKQAVNGQPHELVVKLSQLLEKQGDVEQTKNLFDRICLKLEYHFSNSNDLAECWVEWIEFTLRQEQWDEALSLARQSIAPGGKGPKRLNLTKSVRLWDTLLDLEESLGTVQTTKDAYNRVMDIKAATVQQVLNFAAFLTDREYFEESFAAFEKGIELFAFPHPGSKVLWQSYLEAFTNRYKGTKVERTRDIFQRCLEDCPSQDSSDFFLMNGAYEESYGLSKRALSVYQAMCRKVPAEDKLVAYRLFIAKTTKYLGVTSTRDIYQEAIETLKDQESARICMDFAKMETGLVEIERARAILNYGAQMADPRRLPEYWKLWNEFEISHGNEETFREMLRVKRSVEAAFSTVNYNATGLNEQVDNLTDDQAMRMLADQEGVEQKQLTKVEGFVPSAKRSAAAANLDEVEARVAQLRKVTGEMNKENTNDDADENNEEIDIDDIDAEIEEAAASGHIPEEEEAKASTQKADQEDAEGGIKTKSVPKAVFGGLQQ